MALTGAPEYGPLLVNNVEDEQERKVEATTSNQRTEGQIRRAHEDDGTDRCRHLRRGGDKGNESKADPDTSEVALFGDDVRVAGEAGARDEYRNQAKGKLKPDQSAWIIHHARCGRYSGAKGHVWYNLGRLER